MLSHNQLKQLNFQDIMIFLHLVDLGSAKKTADMMNISPSTVSYCLNKLRDCFDDALFVPIDGTMLPSQKANAILPYMRTMLTSINQCVRLDELSETPQVRWQISAPEYFELLLLPHFNRYMLRLPTPTTLSVQRLDTGLPITALLAQEIDMACGFGSGYHELHPNVTSASLLSDGFCCVTSAPDVMSGHALSLTQFCELPHVFPTPWLSAGNMIDSWLAEIGRKRTILVKANSYQACLHVVAHTPSILCLPKRLLPLLTLAPNLTVVDPPLGCPVFTLDMVWATARSQEPAITTMQHIMRASCAALPRACHHLAH